MLRLKPLPEEKAPEFTKSIYDAIKTSLQTPSVPLYFQYLGNYPDYLAYLWNILVPNIQAQGFIRFSGRIREMAHASVAVIYTPSEHAKILSSQMHPSEKEQIEKTITELRAVNITMMILTIAVRESLKGVHVSAKEITDRSFGTSIEQQPERTIDEIVRESLLSVSSPVSEKQELDAKVASMLVPVYGSNALMLSKYPAFFSLCAIELENVMKTEAYLKTRVEMEKITHLLLLQLPSPIHISYKETAKMLFDKPYAGDLLFLLKDTFPSHFPKLVLATEMMEKIIQS